jgi:hypothetical protein
MKLLKYTHPSVPPEGINANKSYSLDELQSKFNFNQIQILFTPVGEWNWSDLNENKNEVQKDTQKYSKNKKNKEDAKHTDETNEN